MRRYADPSPTQAGFDSSSMHFVRRGSGKPLLLIHGLGGSWRSWNTILDELARQREVIAIDLPGSGATAPLKGENSIPALADAITAFLAKNNLLEVDAVGSSMGARLVLELARRHVLGAVVSLDPGGFWHGWQRHFFYRSIWASIRLVRMLQPVMPQLTESRIGRTLLLTQFSARPWRLRPDITLDEMRSYAAAPTFDELLRHLAYGETQKGAPRGSIRSPLAIGWGRRDRICLPTQAKRASELFPDASLTWFPHSGHFPHWDSPRETIELILRTTGTN